MTSADAAVVPSGRRLLEPHHEVFLAVPSATSFSDRYDQGTPWSSSGPERLVSDARWLLWEAVRSVFELGLCAR